MYNYDILISYWHLITYKPVSLGDLGVVKDYWDGICNDNTHEVVFEALV